MQKYIKFLFIIFLVFFIMPNVKADQQLTLTSKIANVESIENTFTYQITPLNTNPSGASNEPKTITVDFKNIKADEKGIYAQHTIDFSKVSYQRPGIYEYRISEINSSNELCPKSSEEYTILVLVTNNSEGTFTINVQSQVVDKNGEKTELIFNHNFKKESSDNITPPDKKKQEKAHSKAIPKTGLFMNIMPFVILLVIGVFGIIIINKTKKK